MVRATPSFGGRTEGRYALANLRDAEIVIIGGGAVGCSVAYHLARLGKGDVVLLEQAGLTQGATWHAAGLVGQLRGSRNLTRLMQNSVALYEALEAETGQATDWRPVGSLRAASSADRWLELKRMATTARSIDFELHLISPAEAVEHFPLMSAQGVVGAAWVPGDGYIDPSSLTQALARGARAGGVTIHEGERVTGFEFEGRRVTGVVLGERTIRCATLVIAAGMWSRELGALCGIAVPAAAVEHQYLVTEPIEGIGAATPTFRDPDHLVYMKPDAGGLAFGGWEPDTVAFGERGVPADFRQQLLSANFDRFEQHALRAAERVPALGEVGVRDLINGPIPVSADGEPIIGPAPERDNVYLACGFTAGHRRGRRGGPGAGPVDRRRPTPRWTSGRSTCGASATTTPGRAICTSAPSRPTATTTRSTGPARSAPAGAVAGEARSTACWRIRARSTAPKFGWERPNWFAPRDDEGGGTDAVDEPSFGRPNWFDAVGAECRAVRQRVALIDQSSFSKFEVAGPGAFDFLQWLAANDLDRPPGAVTYTQLCNARGGIETDLTIARLGDDHFYIVTGSGFGVHDLSWITRHLPTDGSVTVGEVTSARATINVCGPRARDLLAAVSADDLGANAFPFMSCRRIRIGYAPLLAMRVTYVGELGWELHIPTEYAAHVYELLWDAGRELSLANVGYRALESLRLEKGYRYWGRRHHPRLRPLRGRARLLRGPRQGRLSGPRRARQGKAGRAGAPALLLHPGARGFGPWWRGDPARRPGAWHHNQRRLWLHRGQEHRLWLCAHRGRRRRGRPRRLRDRGLRRGHCGNPPGAGALRPEA